MGADNAAERVIEQRIRRGEWPEDPKRPWITKERTVARYRKRPLEVDAVQFTGHNRAEVEAMLRPHEESPFTGGEAIGALGMYDRNGRLLVADPGDWIIREPDGRGFYPCKADLFELTYEAL